MRTHSNSIPTTIFNMLEEEVDICVVQNSRVKNKSVKIVCSRGMELLGVDGDDDDDVGQMKGIRG